MIYLNSRTSSAALWVQILTVSVLLTLGCRPQSQKEAAKENNAIFKSNLSDLVLGDTLVQKEKYDSAYIYYKRAADEFEKQGNKEKLTTALLKITDLKRIQGDIDEAMLIVEKAIETIDPKNTDDHKILAEVLHKKGLLLNNKGYFDSAASVLNLSIRYKTKLYGTNDTSMSNTYNLLGIAYFYKGDYDNALKNYTIARNLALRRKNPEDADMAMILQNIGIINAQKGEYEKAEEAFTTSLRIHEKVLKSNDPQLSMINLNVGRLKALLNKDSEALEFYNKAEEILVRRAEPGHPYFIYIYSNKGQTYVHMADYEKALIYFNRALALAEVSFDNKHPQILSLNMNIGFVYEKKRDYNNALSFYLASIPEDTDNSSLIKTYSNLASLYNSLNDKIKSDEYYVKALNLAEKFLTPDHPEKGLLYTRYGYFLLYDPLRNNEIDYFNKALAISKKHYGDKSREVSNNYTHIGNYYYMQNQISEALIFYQKAIIAITEGFNDANISVNPAPEKTEADRYLVNALTGKAQALALSGKKSDLVLSLETYKLAVKVLDKLRSTYQDEESKLLISDEAKSTFQKTVGVAIKLFERTNDKKYLAEAFQYSDKSKSAVLINSMHDIEAQHFGKIPNNILALEKQLKLNISTFRRFIYEEQQKAAPDNAMINKWKSRVFEFTVRYDSLTGFLESNYPDYYTLKYTEPSVSISEIQKALADDNVLIEYMLNDSALYTFAISKRSFEVFTQPIDSSFFRNIQTIVSATNNNSMFSTTDKDYVNYALSAFNLHQQLLSQVTEKFDENKLIIIPDGEIGYVSFDMLLTAMPDTNLMDYRRLYYLIKDKIVSYSTSAILQFSGFQKRERKASKNFLAMAPSYENLTDKERTTFTDENGNQVYLLPIPGVEKEMDGIKNSMFAKKIRGKSATEAKFKEEVGEYNVLHLAMHTLINNSQPMLSKLVFYQNNDSLEDGMLNTYELFSMDLNAGLAVLSACNTGSGKLLKGEGIMNLARGFIFAGVPGIVMTMWSVDDESSAEIVSKFYEYLEEGKPKDEALRQAKLDLLAKGDPLKSHPFYWAAYVNIGDNSPMEFRSVMLTYLLYSLITIIIAGTTVFILRRKKTKNQLKISQLA